MTRVNCLGFWGHGRHGRDLPEGLLDLPDLADGARGVDFVRAAADSNEAGGAWVGL